MGIFLVSPRSNLPIQRSLVKRFFHLLLQFFHRFFFFKSGEGVKYDENLHNISFNSTFTVSGTLEKTQVQSFSHMD